MKVRSLLATALVLGCGVAIAAQPSDSTKTAARTPPSKSAKDPEAERLMKERRDNAQYLLLNLAADAGRFNDQMLRARTQARIADVLWTADAERAKAMFRKAWESAEVVDQESQRKVQEEVQKLKANSNGSGYVFSPPSNVRGEVVRLAAKRDRALGEELLAKLNTQQAQEAAANADRLRNNSFGAPEAVTQRLNLARHLLDTDAPRAPAKWRGSGKGLAGSHRPR